MHSLIVADFNANYRSVSLQTTSKVPSCLLQGKSIVLLTPSNATHYCVDITTDSFINKCSFSFYLGIFCDFMYRILCMFYVCCIHYMYTVFRKKHPLMFSIITLAFLGQFFLYFLYQWKGK